MVKWNDQLQYFHSPVNTESYLELTENHLSSSGILSQATLQWKMLKEIQVRLTVRQTCLEEFEDRIIFMSVFNDIDWSKNGNYKDFSNSEMVRDNAKRFPLGRWSGPREEGKWYGTQNYKPEGQWQMCWSPISKTADTQSS